MGLHPNAEWPEPVKRFWREYLKEFECEVDEIEILKTGGNAYARMLEAKCAIDEMGINIITPSGMVRINPACTVEKAARGQLLQALKILNLKKPVKEKAKMGRPLVDAGLGLT